MTIKLRSSISAYLFAGKLLHIITVIELISGYFVVSYLAGLETAKWWSEMLRVFTMIYMISLPVFAQLDARSRFQNYKQIRDQFLLYGFDFRIVKPMINSSCQRQAAELAARDTGYKKQCLNAFYNAGYRWYHFLPDFVFKHPQFLFHPYFWRTTFFCPAYRSQLKMTKNREFIIDYHSFAIAGNG